MNLIQKLANNDNDEHNVNATHYENDEIDEHDEKNAHGEICKNDQKKTIIVIKTKEHYSKQQQTKQVLFKSTCCHNLGWNYNKIQE